MGGFKNRGLGRTKTSGGVSRGVSTYGQSPQLLRMVKTSENPMLPFPSTSETQEDPEPPESPEDAKLMVKAASVCSSVEVAVMVVVPDGKITLSSSRPAGNTTSSEDTSPMMPMVWVTSLVNSKVKVAVSPHPGLRVKLSPLDEIKQP